LRVFLAADPPMVGMIDLGLKPNLFNGYEQLEEPVTCDVNIENLVKDVREARKVLWVEVSCSIL
jgi:hypothetical protein